MKYVCSTCEQEITGWPLKRSHMPYEYWCSAECLIDFQSILDNSKEEIQPLSTEFNRRKKI